MCLWTKPQLRKKHASHQPLLQTSFCFLNRDLHFEQSMNQATYLMSVEYNFRGMPERKRGGCKHIKLIYIFIYAYFPQIEDKRWSAPLLKLTHF